jgi:hypothetical protein
LQFSEVELPQTLADVDFVSAAFTPHMPEVTGGYLLLMGTKDGALVAYDPQSFDFIDRASKHFIVDGQIGSIIIEKSCVVIGSSNGKLIKYPITSGSIFPPTDQSLYSYMETESAITCLAVDKLS